MAPKFALFTKGSKLPLNKGFKNMFELLQSSAQPSICAVSVPPTLRLYQNFLKNSQNYVVLPTHPSICSCICVFVIDNFYMPMASYSDIGITKMYTRFRFVTLIV